MYEKRVGSGLGNEDNDCLHNLANSCSENFLNWKFMDSLNSRSVAPTCSFCIAGGMCCKYSMSPNPKSCFI